MYEVFERKVIYNHSPSKSGIRMAKSRKALKREDGRNEISYRMINNTKSTLRWEESTMPFEMSVTDY